MSDTTVFEIKKGMLATFDNPGDPFASWGKISEIEGDKVWIDEIGWGYKHEIQAIQKTLEGIV